MEPEIVISRDRKSSAAPDFDWDSRQEVAQCIIHVQVLVISGLNQSSL